MRFQSQPYAPEETPLYTWSYADEFGRIERRLEPSHDFIGDDGPALFDLWEAPRLLEYRFGHGVGVTISQGPDGTACQETRSTLHRELACAGTFRGREDLDEFGKVVSTTAADGTETLVGYDDLMRVNSQTTLTSAASCDGITSNPTVTLTHDLLGNLRELVRPDGSTSSWTYDDLGRPRTETIMAPSGDVYPVHEWSYVDANAGLLSSPGGRAVHSTDLNGNTTTEYLDAHGFAYAIQLPNGDEAVRVRDANGRVTESTDVDGLTTYFEHDAHGRITREFHLLDSADSTYCATTGSSTCEIGQSYSYDAAGRVLLTTDADGVQLRHGYTASGQLSFVASGDWLLNAYRYDDRGLTVWAWEEGIESTFTYDALARQTGRCIGDTGAGCEQGQTFGFDSADRVSSVTNADGGVTSYAYDSFDRLVNQINADGTELRMWYDLNGALCAFEDEDGFNSEWEHDVLGRLTAEWSDMLPVPRTYAYADGVRGTDYGVSENVSVTTLTERDGGEWLTASDYAGRPIFAERPDGTAEVNAYVGSRLVTTSTLSATGNVLDIVGRGYDSLGRPSWEWGPVAESTYNASSGIPIDGDYVFHTGYTPAGRMASLTGPVVDSSGTYSSETLYTYDEDGLLVHESIVGITETDYVYDLAHGYPRLQQMATGQPGSPARTTDYFYSDAGLYLAGTYTWGPRSGTVTPEFEAIEYVFEHYDAHGNPRTIETWHTDGAGVDVLLARYDSETDMMGRTRSVDTTINGDHLGEARYAYYDNGDVKKAWTDWSGGLHFTRGRDGNLNGIRSTNTSGRSGGRMMRVRRRDDMGRSLHVTLPNRASVRREYNMVGQLSRLKTRASTGSVDDRRYTYDERGLLSSVSVTAPGRAYTNEFTYSPERWLESETRFAGTSDETLQEFIYDAAGNRIETWTDGLRTMQVEFGSLVAGETTGSAPLRVNTGDGWETLGWDNFGGLIVDHRGFEIERDVLGQASEIWNADGELMATLHRDHTGRPVEVETRDAGTRTHFWGHPTSSVYPLASIDDAGEQVVYAALEQELVGRVVDGVLEAAVTDRLGSLVLSDNDLIELMDAYGSDRPTPTSGMDFVFGGQEELQGTPYLSAQRRLYDPELGMFASLDPIGLEGGNHRLRFVSNRPTQGFDPWGTDADFEIDVDALLDKLEGGVPQEGQQADRESDGPGRGDGDDDNRTGPGHGQEDDNRTGPGHGRESDEGDRGAGRFHRRRRMGCPSWRPRYRLRARGLRVCTNPQFST